MTARAVVGGLALMKAHGIGETETIELPAIAARGRVSLKLEFTNPFGGVKDRTAAYLVAWAHEEGGSRINVVESTSGNLGMALAHIAPELGIKVTLVMDASIPVQRAEELERVGARVEVVHKPRPGMTFRQSRIATAAEIGASPGSLWLNQYANPAGVQAHRETTGPELSHDLNDNIDYLVASVGTGGTICGIAAALRQHRPPPVIVGVEPLGSTISGGEEGDYLPAGSGMRGRPEIVDRHRDFIDLFSKVPDALSAMWVVHLMEEYGLQVGLTTGAAVAVAVMLAEQRNARVAVIAPDRGTFFLPVVQTIARTEPVPRHDHTQVQIMPFTAADLLTDGTDR